MPDTPRFGIDYKGDTIVHDYAVPSTRLTLQTRWRTDVLIRYFTA